ncbi:hypothetical protein [Sphingomonas sp.]|uniref:hypothetical protein n=1 Tax=Sphingomonas sp. TaxID=28214 RepID=UPI001B00C7A6|nr:hypothetical protein [Sphingomonas sp.]MBO9712879.1 hypothetical protein [Sphingomonas sp.]
MVGSVQTGRHEGDSGYGLCVGVLLWAMRRARRRQEAAQLRAGVVPLVAVKARQLPGR